MPDLVPHLSAPELQARFVASRETRAARHVQAIWLLARGHSLEEVAETTAYSTRWVRRLIDRYNAEGPDALGDRRRANGSPRRTLTPEALAQVRERLADPPAPGEVWTCRKVAAVLATNLGRERVATGTGWAALRQLDWSLQQPRPHNPKAATPEAAEAFKKS
jgi:transposase